LWQTTSKTPVCEEAFLCFQRRAGGDILLGEAKICGSAQRRFRRGVLQHGTLLWSRSPFAPELLGLKELAEKTLLEQTLDDLLEKWLERISAVLQRGLTSDALTDQEAATATILAAKHVHASWLVRRKSQHPHLE
jgi:lipoate-protein ligase A